MNSPALILELAPLGSLKNNLQKMSTDCHLTEKEEISFKEILVSFTKQICSGMIHLGEKNVNFLVVK